MKDLPINKIDAERTAVIACATVMEEMRQFLPPGISSKILEFGLHADPDKLREALQAEINAVDSKIETIVLGYGLCSRAVAGLRSETCQLVVPKVDDCIAIFLGSADEYNAQHRNEPGTLYQTKGWIEAGKKEKGKRDERHSAMVKRYGEEKARALLRQMTKNYTRMVFINTGNYELEYYREYSKNEAARLGLRYEEIKGANTLIKKLLLGEWDKDFVVAPPGKALSFLDFR